MPPLVQIAGATAAIGVVVALACLGISWISRDRLVSSSEAAVVQAESANADLQDEMAGLRDQLATASHNRKDAEGRASALAGQVDALRGLLSAAEAKLRAYDDQRTRPTQQQQTGSEEANASSARQIARLRQALEHAQRELQRAEAQRTNLAARLSKIEADRENAVAERDRLRARLAQLEQRHSWHQMLQPFGVVPGFRLAGLISSEIDEADLISSNRDVVITDAPPEPKRDAVDVAELGLRAIGELARVLASTGVDIGRLFSRFGLNRAEGGPFIVPPKADHPDENDREKSEGVRGLIKSLPLLPPLDYYQLESRFGPRHDPFNHRASFHTGVDLSAPYMSPIYATAPGVVTYAGYRGDYGRVVEIDHGNGIATVYAHMHRFIVSVGQRLEAHAPIGFLGSTGRSSGPHVHYEILVNGEPQDPEKFIGLARLIPAAEIAR